MAQFIVYDHVDVVLSPGQIVLMTTVTIPEPIWSYQMALQAFWDAGGSNQGSPQYAYDPAAFQNVYSNAALVAYHDGYTVVPNGIPSIGISTASSDGWRGFTSLTNSSSAGGTSDIVKWSGERNYNVCIVNGFPGGRSRTYLSQTLSLRVSISASATAPVTISGLFLGFTDEAAYNLYPYDCWGSSTYGPVFWGGLNPVAIASPRVSSESTVSAPPTAGRVRSWAQAVG